MKGVSRVYALHKGEGGQGKGRWWKPEMGGSRKPLSCFIERDGVGTNESILKVKGPTYIPMYWGGHSWGGRRVLSRGRRIAENQKKGH